MGFFVGVLCGIIVGAVGIIVVSFWVVPDDEDL